MKNSTEVQSSFLELLAPPTERKITIRVRALTAGYIKQDLVKINEIKKEADRPEGQCIRFRTRPYYDPHLKEYCCLAHAERQLWLAVKDYESCGGRREDFGITKAFMDEKKKLWGGSVG